MKPQASPMLRDLPLPRTTTRHPGGSACLRSAALAALLLATGWSDTASAAPWLQAQAPVQRAQERFTEGMRAYEEGRFQDAAALLTEAYSYDPNPRIAFNIARSWERVGSDEIARQFFQLAFESSDDATVRRFSREAITRIDERLRGQGADAPSRGVTSGRHAGVFVVHTAGEHEARSLRLEHDGSRFPLPASVRLLPGRYVATLLDARDQPLRSWQVDISAGTTILIRARR